MLNKAIKKFSMNIHHYFCFKLKNAEGTLIAGMVETSSKYLIGWVIGLCIYICVGVLYLLDLLAMLGLHRIE